MRKRMGKRIGKRMEIIKRIVAGILIVTILPFSSFAGVGVREVNAAAVSANSIMLPEALPEEITEKIHTHGGEDIDTFVNEILQGEFPEETENVIIEENDTLTEDLVVMDLTLKKGTFDLQGNTLYICGNFIHSGGVLKVNGGRVVVLGDYRIQSPVQKTENEETEKPEKKMGQEKN